MATGCVCLTAESLSTIAGIRDPRWPVDMVMLEGIGLLRGEETPGSVGKVKDTAGAQWQWHPKSVKCVVWFMQSVAWFVCSPSTFRVYLQKNMRKINWRRRRGSSSISTAVASTATAAASGWWMLTKFAISCWPIFTAKLLLLSTASSAFIRHLLAGFLRSSKLLKCLSFAFKGHLICSFRFFHPEIVLWLPG